MAMQQGWPTDHLKFQGMNESSPSLRSLQECDDETTALVNNDIQGLIDSVNDGSTSAFMWEWFTTKPWVDAGKARFVSRFLYTYSL